MTSSDSNLKAMTEHETETSENKNLSCLSKCGYCIYFSIGSLIFLIATFLFIFLIVVNYVVTGCYISENYYPYSLTWFFFSTSMYYIYSIYRFCHHKDIGFKYWILAQIITALLYIIAMIHYPLEVMEFKPPYTVTKYTTNLDNYTYQSDKPIAIISDIQQMPKITSFVGGYINGDKAMVEIVKDLTTYDPQVLYFTGDLSTRGQPEEYALFDHLFGQFKDKPLFNSLGNHDYQEGRGEIYDGYMERFTAEGTVLGTESLHYNYEIINNVAFVRLDSNLSALESIDLDQKQIQWYKETIQTLEQNNQVKLIITMTHAAPINNIQFGFSFYANDNYLIDNFLPIFKNSPKSKMYVSGHIHSTQVIESDNKYYISTSITSFRPCRHTKRYNEHLYANERRPLSYMLLNQNNNSVSVTIRAISSVRPVGDMYTYDSFEVMY